jgi:hypothetical protein
LKDEVKTKLRPGGLRYEAKTTGTEFPGAFGFTMSCFLCSRHVPRTRLVSFLVAGRRQYRCRDGC